MIARNISYSLSHFTNAQIFELETIRDMKIGKIKVISDATKTLIKLKLFFFNLGLNRNVFSALELNRIFLIKNYKTLLFLKDKLKYKPFAPLLL